MRRDVTFQSQGLNCAGWFYLPDDHAAGPRVPAVVMANALSAVKEIYLDQVAARFAAAGLAVLVFDYRYAGESEGEPRGQIFPHEQLDDLRNALSWVQGQPEVDAERIGVWGVSLGGGHVLFLSAFDRRIKAVVSMVPLINGWETPLARMPREAFFGFLEMISQMRVARYRSGQETVLPLVVPPPGEGAMPEEGYHLYTQAARTVAPNWRNEITAESLEKITEYNPSGPIKLIAPTPLLMILAEQDALLLPHLARAAFEQAGDPKELLVLPCRHSEVYNTDPYWAQAADAATGWFTKYLFAG